MIRLVEVAPRDGLQNEATTVPTFAKVAFVNALSSARPHEIEVSAFVSPKWVPQLADAEAVFRAIERHEDVVYSALVPNERGLDRALALAVDKIAVFTAASDTFTRKNVNATIDETLTRFVPVVRRAKVLGMAVRGYISTAFWCPYEGPMAPQRTCQVAQRLLDLGVDELSIGDTIGKAVPGEVRALLDLLLQGVDVSRVAMHFHDTFGRAVDNVLASHAYGVGIYDASACGLGGCPYAPGASGNVATASVVRALRGVGADVRVDLDAMGAACATVAAYVGSGSKNLRR